jgi:hypothetical protein
MQEAVAYIAGDPIFWIDVDTDAHCWTFKGPRQSEFLAVWGLFFLFQ